MILGAILAGGQASRFGSDKAMAVLDGRTLIDHVALALSREVDGAIVCGRAYSGLINVPDRPHSSLGPLGGINAALRYAADNGFAKVLTAPCDTPRISKDLLTALLAAPAPVYLSSLPVLGCWPSALADQLDAYLDQATNLSIRCWAHTIGATLLDRAPPLNINAREDLDLLAGGD
ncbi:MULTISPECIES: molybdenum cofactor guanylyltransferase [unclassified Sphingomonas]|uniref:molybdenum cofactor guanylyltransferase n=1 Tax=unclassified Sphingomonas TaxID=196159 RepID=UPI0021515282|nr:MULTISPECIES: molybdenum cofactor guanylyltransferase [unclassified Sphingomonas]MCR5870906.1 molybdenum cofactor guanylyltransferase [Sphingomonas sp. J344]UUY00774.1 molybdenum cofactor guanylyltransferase [Sphingomonas sp. J315]